MSQTDDEPRKNMPPPNLDAQSPMEAQQRRGATVWILVAVVLLILIAVIVFVAI